MLQVHIEDFLLRLVHLRRGQRRARWIGPGNGCRVACIAALIMALTGCGGTSSSGGAKAGPISTTNAAGVAGHIASLTLGSKASFSMMPVGDNSNAGVDWTVTCEGNPVTGSTSNGACGTLAPAHTADGAATVYTAPSVAPIGESITVTATVTSNPSQSSSVSLTIVGLPIGIKFYNTTPPQSLEINATLGLNVQVTNDPAGAGVIWTVACGSTSVCGSFNPAVVNTPDSTVFFTTYTAPAVVPAGGAVTITATSLTDTTKSVSATLTIIAPPPPVPVTVSVLPPSVYVATAGSARSTSLTAIVTNDPQAAGVDWSLSCGASSCGTLDGSKTVHTASGVAVSYAGLSATPPGGTVTITAASTTNPAVSASATATIVTAAPIVVTMPSAPPAVLTTESQATLAATVTGDAGNLGVNWTASCGSAGACGSFNLSPAHTASAGQIVYTAPASVPTGGLVTITASSPASTPSNSAIAFTTVVAAPPSLAFKQMPPATMTATAQAPVSATVANDVPPGGVNWSVQCSSTIPGGCGWVGPAQTASGATATYNAPPVTTTGTAVTIVATSVADPSVSISSSPITISPSTVLSVSFIPSLPAQVQTNATVNLTAAVANDTTNAGVDWQVCGSGCGFFTVKPAIPAIPATSTTPYVPAVPAVTAPSVSGWSNGLPIPYTAPSEPPTSGVVVVTALSHANTSKVTMGSISIGTQPGGSALSGNVKAGTQPVVGASVFLYAAGASGYASASSKIATATTDKNGNFTEAAGYACPSPTSQMYLVATGGKVGANAANPNLSLMTALGNCNGLGSSAVVINEVTTVASVWATSPFAANDELTGNSSYLYLGTSSGNLSGLANAFAAVNNLVDITTGQARFVTPAWNATVPYAWLDTLADFLNACTATSGGVEGDGSPCSILFAAADTLGTGVFSGSIGPSDTLQAAFNIAQHPVTPINGNGNGGEGQYNLDRDTNLFTLATSSSPFQPILVADPREWPISLNYTGGGGLTPASTVGSFAVDANGNLWITDTTGGSVIEWNAVGAALSPSTGFPAGGGPIAIDANGNVWVSGNGILSELTNLGTPVAGSPFVGAAGGGSDMAFDAQGNLWIGNTGGVNEFNNLGMELSPASGFANGGISGITALGIDSSNNVWIASPVPNSSGVFSFSELTNPGGGLIVSSQINATVFPELAADGAGDIWGATDSSAGIVCKVPPYGGQGAVLTATCDSGAGYPQTSGSLPIPAYAQGLAFDGAGGLWIAAQGGEATIIDAQGNFESAGNSIPIPGVGSLRAAVDGSGNLWVLLANNTVIEHIGAATPVVTPIALGVKNKKLAAKP